jgi:hypothetical protein
MDSHNAMNGIKVYFLPFDSFFIGLKACSPMHLSKNELRIMRAEGHAGKIEA